MNTDRPKVCTAQTLCDVFSTLCNSLPNDTNYRGFCHSFPAKPRFGAWKVIFGKKMYCCFTRFKTDSDLSGHPNPRLVSFQKVIALIPVFSPGTLRANANARTLLMAPAHLKDSTSWFDWREICRPTRKLNNSTSRSSSKSSGFTLSLIFSIAL